MKIILLITFLISPLLYCAEIKIQQLKGLVTLDGNTAKLGDTVLVGQKIKAHGKKSFFQIKYSSGSKILVRDGSIIIHQLSANKKSVKLLNETSFYSIRKKEKEHFKVFTRYASFGVRGTKFLLKSDSKESYLCVCEGSVMAKNKVSSHIVLKKEDIHMTRKSNFKKTSANDDMWLMALEGFKTMDQAQ